MGAAVSAPVDAVGEGVCAASEELEVGRELGMVVDAVGRFVMKDCSADIPATITEVDVLTCIMVLGGDGGVCRAGEGEEASELMVAEFISLLEAVLLVVDVAGDPGFRIGEKTLFKPLSPSHMGSVESVQKSAMLNLQCCRRVFDHTDFERSIKV